MNIMVTCDLNGNLPWNMVVIYLGLRWQLLLNMVVI